MYKHCFDQSKIGIWMLSAMIWGVVTHTPVWAEQAAPTAPLDIHNTRVKAISVRQQTQDAEEAWSRTETGLKTRYHALVAERTSLEREKAVLVEQIAALQGLQMEAARNISAAAEIGKGLQSHLDAVVARLEERIARDLPFLVAERAERMARIRQDMVQPEAGIAEKYRRVMEALKVETEYGQTVEVYQEAIRIDGGADAPPVMADILRLGRLALFWRTPDGKTVGHWDRAAAQWTILPDRYRRHINDATEMALKRRTVELVKLPLGRIAKP